MINLCTDPTCDETAALSIQRQGDIAPVGYCLPHGYQRENELRQKLENFATVVLERPATELELALSRVQELEEELTQPDGQTVDGEHGLKQPGALETEEQLETALHTLEMQSATLKTTRGELADREQALQSLRRELDRTRAELTKAKDDLALCRVELDRFKANEAAGPRVEGGPVTPPPPTRPDPK
jgi:DNA repair exonuclease SbcCD ATPase subunit